jgi:diaminopimelate epimerase
MKLYKYQGTGNDFIMVDNRLQNFPVNDVKLIEKLCNRRFGIGADGLILLENDTETDFKMVYFNSDGNQSTMCGNGGRCLVAFAKKLGIIKDKTTFMAIDGLHHATIDDSGLVSLQMKDVHEINVQNDYVFLDTGSPHHIQLVENLQNIDVNKDGAIIRYSGLYGKEGSNVNFVNQISNSEFTIRTYERGVEDETLSCGTGATATAIAMFATGKTNTNNLIINVAGGKLNVTFQENNGFFTQVFLTGPAEFVFATNFEN